MASEKLIELLDTIHHTPLGKTYHERIAAIADYLIANGVRLETNQATSEENKRWIPVTERLPEEMKPVLAWTPMNEFMETAMWTGIRWEKTWDFDTIYTVTHWMPLPEPPKED